MEYQAGMDGAVDIYDFPDTAVCDHISNVVLRRLAACKQPVIDNGDI